MVLVKFVLSLTTYNTQRACLQWFVLQQIFNNNTGYINFHEESSQSERKEVEDKVLVWTKPADFQKLICGPLVFYGPRIEIHCTM